MRLGERQLQKRKIVSLPACVAGAEGEGKWGGRKAQSPSFFSFLTIPYPFRRLLRGLGAFAKELILKCSYVSDRIEFGRVGF